MRRLTPGRGPSSRPGQLYAVEETPSQKLDSLSRNRRLSRVSSIPARQFQAGCPIEKPIPKTKTKKNEPTRRRIYNRTTPGEKGGLGRPTHKQLHSSPAGELQSPPAWQPFWLLLSKFWNAQIESALASGSPG